MNSIDVDKKPKPRGRPKKDEVYTDKPPKLVQKRLYARKYRERIRDQVKDLENERDFYKKLVEFLQSEQTRYCPSCQQPIWQPESPAVYMYPEAVQTQIRTNTPPAVSCAWQMQQQAMAQSPMWLHQNTY
ncbi:hypothetical protein QR680_000342 [Steinernema hermaphroditum]|uniref:BZIP domain-containing protein n=1 Tax=Steinernema hermaphroditum TaxID=289476 RepID=A0AA39LDX4_9BILA|nr:hypothetical protein QR680_000342 [Steinernema hermaphroditum]